MSERVVDFYNEKYASTVSLDSAKTSIQRIIDDIISQIDEQDERLRMTPIRFFKEYVEKKIRMDVDKWQRLIELKLELDENWKKMYTDTTANSKVDIEFQDEDIEQSVRKVQYELLYSKAQTITEFINIVKLNNKALFTI